MNATKTIRQFVARNRINASVEYADNNPHMEGSENMNNYKVTLRRAGKQCTVHFSTGMGWTREPGAEDVLDCLASDAAGFENARDFEGWCGDYGYDTDSRKAERTYKTIERQAEKLKALLGDDLYKELLWETERM